MSNPSPVSRPSTSRHQPLLRALLWGLPLGLIPLASLAPSLPAHAQAGPNAPFVTPEGKPVGATELAAKLDAIEKTLDTRRQALNVPGASLVIVKNDTVIYLKGLGLRDHGRKLAVTPDTLFAIGSTTKAFTATTVLMSQQDGKLRLSDSPRKFLDHFKLRDAETEAKITLEDLLSHRSGLDRTDLCWISGKLDRRQILKAVATAKPTAKLGEKFQYQNPMYLAAGLCVGEVQDGDWEDVLERRIFRPLRMVRSNTSAQVTLKDADHALGYTYKAEAKETVHLPMRDIREIGPAGSINSSARDMGQWLRFLVNRGNFQGQQLLTEPNFAQLGVKRINVNPGGSVGYGLGWFLRTWNGHPVWEHGGNIDGFTAQVAVMPDQRLGFALLTNANATSLGAEAMPVIWKHLVGEPVITAPPTPIGPVPTGPALNPQQEVGSYLLTQANLTLEVLMQDGKLVLKQPGVPLMTLEPIGGRRYRVSAPAPPGTEVTFRPSAEKADVPEMALLQGGSTLILKRAGTAAEPVKAPITVDELMAKVVQASGGEANLRKHRVRQHVATLDLENQGVTGEAVQTFRAPNSYAMQITMKAGGEKILSIREYFDGKNGGEETTFTLTETKSPTELAAARIEGNFAADADWKTLYKTVTLKKMDRVGDDEVYVVEKTPETGPAITDYVSTRSWMVVKRTKGAVSETFSDFHTVDGVVLPYRTEVFQPGQGKTVITTREVKFNVKVPEKLFQPTPVKKGRAERGRRG